MEYHGIHSLKNLGIGEKLQTADPRIQGRTGRVWAGGFSIVPRPSVGLEPLPPH